MSRELHGESVPGKVFGAGCRPFGTGSAVFCKVLSQPNKIVSFWRPIFCRGSDNGFAVRVIRFFIFSAVAALAL
ncbi:hypothetical protein [Thermodesulfitimonas autotrophica]|uniref:hypothetical protein n=1 Tax=Thermodesulfitimonas autotrophica TaxID=1894989 RepID=UPI000F4F0E51|nr:hypothetical protein [Thermodesulfitimonas autotrophica]